MRIVLLDDALNFVRSLPQKAQEKVTYNMLKVKHGVMDSTLFKKLDNTDIWEFRTIYFGNCYRLFAFWDDGNEYLVIATHGISKKTKRVPLKEIKRAESIKKRYFEFKEK